MSDISTQWNPDAGYGDFVVVPPSLASGNDLETAIFLSIFTDRQAGPDDVIPDGTTIRRGWWADDLNYPLGSRLWLLSRSKATKDVLRRAHDYVTEAVQWLLDDGVVAKFNIYCEFTTPTMLGIQIVPYDRDGNILAVNYRHLWSLS